jgi:hypothetical protein
MHIQKNSTKSNNFAKKIVICDETVVGIEEIL